MATGFKAYPFDELEPKWQNFWVSKKIFRTPNPGEPGGDKPKYYVLDMFPYPSGSGLHVGHLEGYTATDIIARYKRMRGFNVLHPIGWDAFGLPAEQHAVETGTHPRATTQKNIDNFRRQIQQIGFTYDWDREVNTTDPHYFRWTQWIFTKLLERGLAYEAEIAVNWCPALGTVLANEEVIDGKSERGGHPVVRKPMRQWVLKITAYAERLLSDLNLLDWPEPIKEQQRNWIGRSIGAEVDFRLVTEIHPRGGGDLEAGFPPKACGNDKGGKSEDDKGGKSGNDIGEEDGNDKPVIRVFTTRPDTLFGATYMVLAPEHAAVRKITTTDQKTAVENYIQKASLKSDLDRTDLAKDKTGVFTGAYAVNPVNGKKIPVWIADYVLISYGTGAIMAVPAHDERDFEFAQKYDLPIVQVIKPEIASSSAGKDWQSPRNDKGGSVESGDVHTSSFVIASPEGAKQSERVFTGNGICFNSATPDGSFSLNELKSDEAKGKIAVWLESKGLGKKSVQYKLRDWIFSRQRYWGEPIPVIHCAKCGIVCEPHLPLTLPELLDFKPTGDGEPPLAKASHEWGNPKCPQCGGQTTSRETNTMPQWAGSCWYYLRYIDPRNSDALIDPVREKHWMNVDLYVGGAEHAVLHLLYSRFWHKVLYDLGVVSTLEPFQKLVNQGMILGEDNQKMSKSRGNVVNPDDLIHRYGADSVRLYEMFMGPLEQTKPWSNQGVEGVHRFLARIWRLLIAESGLNPAIQDREPNPQELKRLHAVIKKVTEDIEGIRLNTAISALMIFLNETLKDANHSRGMLQSFVLLLAPFAPHMAEELWHRLGNTEPLAYAPWPAYDSKYLIEDTVEMAVMIQGKVRAKVVVAKETPRESVQEQALNDPQVKKWLEGKSVKQVIVVPGRTVNIVLAG